MKQIPARVSLALLSLAFGLVPHILGAQSSSAATQASSPAQAPSKPYALFMGNDVDIPYKEAFHRVQNIVGNDLVIRVGGQSKIVSGRSLESFKLNYGLKLSHISATIDGFKYERTYTPANDPGRRLIEQVGNAYAQNYADQQAMNKAMTSQLAAEQGLSAAQSSGGGNAAGAAQSMAAVQAAQAKLQQLQSMSGSVPTNASTGVHAPAVDAYDAIDVSFRITSPVVLEHPYIVFIATYRLPSDSAKDEHRFLFGREIPAIGPGPVEVSFQRGGLPAGFEVTSHELHVYQNAREIATNLSSRRVDMTREAVATYLRVNHIADHRNDSAPAGAILLPNVEVGKLRIPRTKLLDHFFVKVDAKGLIVRVSSDPNGVHDATPEQNEALRDFIFVPAVNKGIPSESSIALRVIDFL